MELTTLLPVMVALACPIAMGLMMWMMGRNMGGQTVPTQPSNAERMQALHTQQQRLEEEIAETEKIVALETQKEALAREQSAMPERHLQPLVGMHN